MLTFPISTLYFVHSFIFFISSVKNIETYKGLAVLSLLYVLDVPVNQRMEAVQCALLLLPDEHREALFTLLDFLYAVSTHANTNQMTASNLAVCLAPSLFHWQPVPSRSSSVSPRRRNKTSGSGVPDAKELGQNKAAHDCLLALIKHHREFYTVSTPAPQLQTVKKSKL